MKNLANLVARILMVLMLSVAGVYLLPDGDLRIRYIISKIIPSVEYAPKIAEDEAEIEQETQTDDDNQYSESSQNIGTTRHHDIAPTAQLRSKRQAVRNVVGENYLDAVLSAGKLERWNPSSFPLKVYLNIDSSTPNDYIQEVRNAFSTWEKETNGFMRFVYTNSQSNANFVCNFRSDLKNRGCDNNGAGMAAYQYFTYKNDGSIDKSIVNFSAYACNGQGWPKDFFYSCALHEIGHGLGLRGHSTNKNDLMYPVATANGRMKVSKADMNTLRAVYSMIPDTIDIPLSSEQKKKLIKTDDFYGNTYVRADFQIQQIKENIKLTPEQYGLYIELARAYQDKKDYNSAISAYATALKKIDDKNTAAGILSEVAQLYIEIKKYPSAEKCIDKALSYGNNDNITGLLVNIGVEYGNQRNYTDAVRLFEKALNHAQGEELRQLIYNNLCWIAYKSKDKVLYKKYLKYLKK